MRRKCGVRCRDLTRLWRCGGKRIGGGSTRRKWKERNEAVVREINYRKQTGTLFSEEPVAPVQAVTGSAGAREVMPASYADDIRRIHRALDAEESGLRKPNANDRLVVARSAAYARGDLAQVARCDAQAARRQAVKRAARQRRKARRAQARVEVADMQRDPPSDAEQ